MHKRSIVGLVAGCALLVLAATASVFAGGSTEGASESGARAGLRIVAAENFYGDIASQIVGSYGTVASILSDPSVDPHEYESNVNDAKRVADANLVIENGGGYDAWMDKLLSASPASGRLLVTAYDIAPLKLPDNEHVWYSIDNVRAIAKVITEDLKKLDPQHASDFDSSLKTFSGALDPISKKIDEIASRFAGVPIALTETIFLYQSGPMALKVITPFAFEKAIAEGNDPPADSVIETENQIRDRKVRALVYNEQTVDKITTALRQLAIRAGIPVVPVTETMPPSLHYQRWMLGQITALEQALSSEK